MFLKLYGYKFLIIKWLKFYKGSIKSYDCLLTEQLHNETSPSLFFYVGAQDYLRVVSACDFSERPALTRDYAELSIFFRG